MEEAQSTDPAETIQETQVVETAEKASIVEEALSTPSQELKNALEELQRAQQNMKMMGATRPIQDPAPPPNRKQRRATEKAQRRGKRQMIAQMKRMMAREAAKLSEGSGTQPTNLADFLNVTPEAITL